MLMQDNRGLNPFMQEIKIVFHRIYHHDDCINDSSWPTISDPVRSGYRILDGVGYCSPSQCIKWLWQRGRGALIIFSWFNIRGKNFHPCIRPRTQSALRFFKAKHFYRFPATGCVTIFLPHIGYNREMAKDYGKPNPYSFLDFVSYNG